MFPTGSSPLTRGKPGDKRDFTECERLIPAHAGKTRFHPVDAHGLPGSSPLTRGKLPLPVVLVQ